LFAYPSRAGTHPVFKLIFKEIVASESLYSFSLQPFYFKDEKELPLKVKLIEMDVAKNGVIRKVYIKRRGAEIFRKCHPFPILSDPFKGTFIISGLSTSLALL
jgi:hypothetical protein